MKLLCLLLLALAGCATTVRYPNGTVALNTTADMRDLSWIMRRNGDVEFRAAMVSQSGPIRSSGSLVGTAGSAAMGIATSLSTYGAFR